MTSNKPYLVRAIYEWITDNHQIPYLLVDTLIKGVVVPQEHIHNNQVVLNVAFQVVNNLSIANDEVRFDARFQGVPQHICVPMSAVKAIYSKETGKGMGFETGDDGDSDGGGALGGKSKGAGGHLRIVK